MTNHKTSSFLLIQCYLYCYLFQAGITVVHSLEVSKDAKVCGKQVLIAPCNEAKAVYRECARLFHPDRNSMSSTKVLDQLNSDMQHINMCYSKRTCDWKKPKQEVHEDKKDDFGEAAVMKNKKKKKQKSKYSSSDNYQSKSEHQHVGQRSRAYDNEMTIALSKLPKDLRELLRLGKSLGSKSLNTYYEYLGFGLEEYIGNFFKGLELAIKNKSYPVANILVSTIVEALIELSSRDRGFEKTIFNPKRHALLSRTMKTFNDNVSCEKFMMSYSKKFYR